MTDEDARRLIESWVDLSDDELRARLRERWPWLDADMSVMMKSVRRSPQRSPDVLIALLVEG